MFYLKVILKGLVVYKWKGLIFLLSTFGLIYLSLSIGKVSSVIQKIVEVESRLPYFTVLIDDSGLGEVAVRKVKRLPGVDSVIVKNEKELKKNLDKGLGLLETKLPESLKNINYYAFKVRLDKGISEKSTGLIREYIERLMRDHVTVMSEVIFPETQKSKAISPVKSFFITWGEALAVFVVLSLWFFSGLLFVRDYRKYCYLIEEFQRRKNVATKGLFSFFALVFLFIAPIVYIDQTINFYSLAFLFLVVSIFSFFNNKPFNWSRDR